MPGVFTRSNVIRGGGNPSIDIKLFGDWEKAIKMVQTMDLRIKAASIKAQLKVGNQIVKKVKAHLRNQDLGWKKLNPEYAEKKSQKGRDPRTLISLGTYYNNIEVWQKGSQHMVFIGVKRGIYTKDLLGRRSRIDVSMIAALHEFSTGRRFPRRPLWNPVISELGGVRGIKKMYLNSFKYWLRTMGLPVTETVNMLGWR